MRLSVLAAVASIAAQGRQVRYAVFSDSDFGGEAQLFGRALTELKLDVPPLLVAKT